MKKSDRATNFIFVGFLFLFLLLHGILPDKTFSDDENRTLAVFPEITLGEVLSGETARSLEKYVQDQFPFRSPFVAARTAMEILQGKRLVSGVYLAKQDTLIQQFNTLDEERYQINLRRINDFAQQVDVPVDALVIPSSVLINEELLPDPHDDLDQRALLDRIQQDLTEVNWIEVTSALSQASENPFYRTDHHLNAFGSYLTYQAYHNALQLPVTEFTFETVASNFKGTLSSKSGAFWIKGDPILKPVNELETTVCVRYDGQEEQFDSVYKEENLNIKDKYTYYLDGNHALVEITTSASNDEQLLVLTDSYGHSLAPFLIHDYAKITFVDLRYYHGTVSEMLEETDRVLIYYGIESFVSDVNFAWLK